MIEVLNNQSSVKPTLPFSYDEIYKSVINEFKDRGYDINYRGSNISQIASIMSYVAAMLNAQTAVNINENLLPLAKKRDNILKDARVLGYEAHKKKSYIYRIRLVPKVAGKIHIKKYTEFIIDSKKYYYIGSDIIINNSNITDAMNSHVTIDVKEGELYHFEKLPDLKVRMDGIHQYIDIPYEDIEDDGIDVYVSMFEPLKGRITRELWTKREQRNNLVKEENRNIFWREDNIKTGTPRIIFEKGNQGTRIPEGALVELVLLKSRGSSGAVSSYDITLPKDLERVLRVDESFMPGIIQEGDDDESDENIKINAPLIDNTAGRCVTGTDYKSLCENHGAVYVANIWGGEDEFPSKKGTIYFSLAPYMNDIYQTYNNEALTGDVTNTNQNFTYKLENPYDDLHLSDSQLASNMRDTKGNLINLGILDKIKEYRLPALKEIVKPPVYIFADFWIDIKKNYASINSANIRRDIFNALLNYSKNIQNFDVDFFKSNFLRRTSKVASDIMGIEFKTRFKLLIDKNNCAREVSRSFELNQNKCFIHWRTIDYSFNKKHFKLKIYLPKVAKRGDTITLTFNKNVIRNSKEFFTAVKEYKVNQNNLRNGYITDEFNYDQAVNVDRDSLVVKVKNSVTGDYSQGINLSTHYIDNKIVYYDSLISLNAIDVIVGIADFQNAGDIIQIDKLYDTYKIGDKVPELFSSYISRKMKEIFSLRYGKIVSGKFTDQPIEVMLEEINTKYSNIIGSKKIKHKTDFINIKDKIINTSSNKELAKKEYQKYIDHFNSYYVRINVINETLLNNMTNKDLNEVRSLVEEPILLKDHARYNLAELRHKNNQITKEEYENIIYECACYNDVYEELNKLTDETSRATFKPAMIEVDKDYIKNYNDMVESLMKNERIFYTVTKEDVISKYARIRRPIKGLFAGLVSPNTLKVTYYYKPWEESQTKQIQTKARIPEVRINPTNEDAYKRESSAYLNELDMVSHINIINKVDSYRDPVDFVYKVINEYNIEKNTEEHKVSVLFPEDEDLYNVGDIINISDLNDPDYSIDYKVTQKDVDNKRANIKYNKTDIKLIDIDYIDINNNRIDCMDYVLKDKDLRIINTIKDDKLSFRTDDNKISFPYSEFFNESSEPRFIKKESVTMAFDFINEYDIRNLVANLTAELKDKINGYTGKTEDNIDKISLRVVPVITEEQERAHVKQNDDNENIVSFNYILSKNGLINLQCRLYKKVNYSLLDPSNGAIVTSIIKHAKAYANKDIITSRNIIDMFGVFRRYYKDNNSINKAKYDALKKNYTAKYGVSTFGKGIFSSLEAMYEYDIMNYNSKWFILIDDSKLIGSSTPDSLGDSVKAYKWSLIDKTYQFFNFINLKHMDNNVDEGDGGIYAYLSIPYDDIYNGKELNTDILPRIDTKNALGNRDIFVDYSLGTSKSLSYNFPIMVDEEGYKDLDLRNMEYIKFPIYAGVNVEGSVDLERRNDEIENLLLLDKNRSDKNELEIEYKLNKKLLAENDVRLIGTYTIVNSNKPYIRLKFRNWIVDAGNKVVLDLVYNTDNFKLEKNTILKIRNVYFDTGKAYERDYEKDFKPNIETDYILDYKDLV